MRLGISRVVAVELLPTACVFLKAVLRYSKTQGTLRRGYLQQKWLNSG
ncbi:MAG: hypothetical protein QW503_02700 [Sulfolobales archaeon]